MSTEHGGGAGEVLDSGAKDGFARFFAFLSLIPQVIWTFTSKDETERTVGRYHAAAGDGGGGH